MLKHQRKFWDLENRIVLLIGGYGSGKTYIGALKCIQMSYLNAPIPGMYISPSHQLATKTIIETLKDICNRASINYTYNQQRSEFIFHNWNGVLWFGSGDKPDSLRGSNIAYAVIDEPFIQKRDVFNQMIARVRHPEAVKSQIFLTGTPEQLNWGFALANDQSMDIGVVNASTLDNPHLSDDYKQSLLKAYSQEQIDAYVHGKFVNLTQGRVYKEFDREQHVIERPDLKETGLEIGIAMDYNVDALTSIIFYKGNGWIHVFDEVRLKNANTYDMMEVLSKKYPQSVCYPDSSGSARRSSSVQSDHAIVRSYGFTISAPKANPPVKDRVNAVNKLIREGNFSCENCPNLIMDLERNVWKGNDIDKTSDKEQTHASDAIGYAINRLYPVRKRVMVSKSW
jgi:PBSX family phage terminase large subunit